MLVVGSKLSPSDTAWENTKLLDPTRQSILSRSTIEPRHASWNYPAETVVLGDAAQGAGATLRGRKAACAAEPPARPRPAASRAIARHKAISTRRPIRPTTSRSCRSGDRRIDAQPCRQGGS